MKRMWSKNELKLLATLMATQALQSGDIDNVKVFENIVDKDGHKRFIEGNINLIESIDSGITKAYGKWSLSGSHLLIVLAVNVSANTRIGSITLVNPLSIPQWIKEKISPIVRTIIIRKNEVLYANVSTTSNDITCYLEKQSNGELIITTGSGELKPIEDSSIRIAFDLLIDNE